MADMTTISAQVPTDLYQSLMSAAKQLDRSSSSIIRKALAAYLQDLKEDIEDYNDAVRILAEDNETIPWEEVMRNCGLEV